jgi:hypothetical protein
MGLIRCPVTSVKRNIPEERRSHQHCDRSLKSLFGVAVIIVAIVVATVVVVAAASWECYVV